MTKDTHGNCDSCDKECDDHKDFTEKFDELRDLQIAFGIAKWITGLVLAALFTVAVSGLVQISIFKDKYHEDAVQLQKDLSSIRESIKK